MTVVLTHPDSIGTRCRHNTETWHQQSLQAMEQLTGSYKQLDFSKLYLNYLSISDTVGSLSVGASVHRGYISIDPKSDFDRICIICVSNRESLKYSGNIEAIQIVDDLKKLEDNWDHDGALAPDSETISRVKQLVADLDKLDFVVFDVYPGPNGDISITLKNNDKEVDIIIYPSKFNSQLVRTSDTEPGKQVVFTRENLDLFLSWLIKENDPSSKRTKSIVD